jgi:hypothetical protein
MDCEGARAFRAAKDRNGLLGVSAAVVQVKSRVEPQASLFAAPILIREQLLFSGQHVASEPDGRKMPLLVVLWIILRNSGISFRLAFDGRLGRKRVFRPCVLGISSAQIFSHLMIGCRPEATQIVGDLDWPIVGSEEME